MGVKYFQKFDVRCDHRYQISLFFSFQLGRAESAQGFKNLIPDQRQQFKSNKVIACLLPVPEKSS